MEGFLKGNALEYPEFCQFVEVMITTSPNTWDIENAYWRVEIITIKRSNQLKFDRLETLFFVSANLQISVKSPFQYEYEVTYLEENN